MSEQLIANVKSSKEGLEWIRSRCFTDGHIRASHIAPSFAALEDFMIGCYFIKEAAIDKKLPVDVKISFLPQHVKHRDDPLGQYNKITIVITAHH